MKNSQNKQENYITKNEGGIKNIALLIIFISVSSVLLIEGLFETNSFGHIQVVSEDINGESRVILEPETYLRWFGAVSTYANTGELSLDSNDSISGLNNPVKRFVASYEINATPEQWIKLKKYLDSTKRELHSVIKEDVEKAINSTVKLMNAGRVTDNYSEFRQRIIEQFKQPKEEVGNKKNDIEDSELNLENNTGYGLYFHRIEIEFSDVVDKTNKSANNKIDSIRKVKELTRKADSILAEIRKRNAIDAVNKAIKMAEGRELMFKNLIKKAREEGREEGIEEGRKKTREELEEEFQRRVEIAIHLSKLSGLVMITGIKKQ